MKWIKRLLIVIAVLLLLIVFAVIFTDLNNPVPDIVYASL